MSAAVLKTAGRRRAIAANGGIRLNDVDKYIKKLPEDARIMLEKMRAIIRQAAPKATEKLYYSMPAFAHHGALVCYAVFTNHCSLFPMSSAMLREFQEELGAYETSKGTIRFPLGKRLPVTLIKKIVKARIAENETKMRLKEAKRAAKSKSPAKKPATRKRQVT
jgi:uncharacterized protein YdhG (YjbR/CyaY superfamily)